MKTDNSYSVKAIDLFCGIGGLSFGLKKAGISVLAGIDFDKTCQYAYEKNVQGDFISSDIKEISGDFLEANYWSNSRDIRILVGCAPCQPFSSHSNKNPNKKKSEKWSLLSDFLRLIGETKPVVVSMENVPNLSNQDIFKDFLAQLESLGYKVTYSNVFCPDYGIPQRRRRLVLLASKLGKISLIERTHNPSNYVNTHRVIGNLPPVKSGDVHPEDKLHRTTKLSPINEKRIKASRPNGTWLDWDESLRLECHKKASGFSYKSVYGRMSWDEPSPTITTQFFNYGTGRFGHPVQDRALTLREAALLQTFPKSYKLCALHEEVSITRIGTHIGNAVPVKLGFVIGKSILRHLHGYGIK